MTMTEQYRTVRDRVESTSWSSCLDNDPVATAPGTDLITQAHPRQIKTLLAQNFCPKDAAVYNAPVIQRRQTRWSP